MVKCCPMCGSTAIYKSYLSDGYYCDDCKCEFLEPIEINGSEKNNFVG